VYNGRLYLAWKGEGNAVGIWWSSFDGMNWSPQQQHPEAGTSDEPALTVFGGVLYLAWKGENESVGIWASSFDGGAWSRQQQVPQAGTSAGPALAAFNNDLYFAWKGEWTSTSIWFSDFDAFPPTHLDFDTGYITFSGGVPVDGFAHLTVFQDGTSHFTGHFHDSSIVPYTYGIALVVKGIDNHAYSSVHQGNITQAENQGNSDWDEKTQNPDITQHWPALLNGGAPFFAWRADVNLDIVTIVQDAETAIGYVVQVVSLFA
jgi:hypothetical protein